MPRDGDWMLVEAWALFCLTEFVLCLNPGPSNLVVMSQSLTRGASAGLRATAGVIAANAIYFAVSASGLLALHSLSAEAFSIIKWCGAAYIAWVGLSLIIRSFKSAPVAQRSPSTDSTQFVLAWVRHTGGQPESPRVLHCDPPAVHQPRSSGRSTGRRVGLQLICDRVSGSLGVRCPLWSSGRGGCAAIPRNARTSRRRPPDRCSNGHSWTRARVTRGMTRARSRQQSAERCRIR